MFDTVHVSPHMRRLRQGRARPDIRPSHDRGLEDSLEEVRSELRRTREELALLRATTARLMTAMANKVNRAEAEAVAVFPPEIRDLARLSSESGAQAASDPVTGKFEAIRADPRDSLAYLDRRFRWIRVRRSAPTPTTAVAADERYGVI